MVSFAKVLSPPDAEAIRAFVVQLATQARNSPAPVGGGGAGAGPAAAPAPAPARGVETAPALHR